MIHKGRNTLPSIILITIFLLGAIAQAGPVTSTDHIDYISQHNTSLTTNWLLMYYLNGDNLLHPVQLQTIEIIRTIGSTDDVSIAILHDGDQDGDTTLYYLEGNELVQQSWETESNMADAATIQAFIQRARSDHTSNYDALILSSNKGSGWQGIMWDETNGNNLQIQLPELSSALSQATNQGAEKLDVFAIETCMAGMTENAYEIKDYANYFIAYEDCSYAGYVPYSWPFQGPLSDLIANPDMSPEEFSVNHLNYFESKRFSLNRITTVMTVTNLNELSTVKESLDDLADYLMDHIGQYREDIHTAIEETRVLGELWYIDFYLDPVHFLNLLSIDDTEFTPLKESVISAYEQAVVACDHVEDDPVCGLSIHLPRRKADYDHSFRFDTLLSSYDNTDFAHDGSWDEFLKSFLQIDENTAPDTPTINGETRGEPGTEYEFTVTATDAENDDLYLYIDWGDGNATGWAGPYESGEEVTVAYTWAVEGTYDVRVKAKDYDESEWGTLRVKMPKNKILTGDTVAWKFLLGTISDIEYDSKYRFRFLPILMLDFGFSPEDGFSVMIRNKDDGPFPCCGYIDPGEFTGVVRLDSIIGIWKI